MNAEILKSLLEKHRVTLILAFPVTLLFFVTSLPYHYSWFYWHMRLSFLRALILGALELLYFPTGTVEGPPALGYIIHAIFSISLALLVSVIWRKGVWGILFIGANLCIGLFLAGFAADYLVASAKVQCQESVSQNTKLEIIGFKNGRGDYDSFFLLSQDEGNSWDQVMTAHTDGWDGIPPPDCENLGWIDSEFIWFWSGPNVKVTKDSGSTWNEWEWSCPSGAECYGWAQNVYFMDKNIGVIKVWPRQSNISEIHTNDGGITWREIKE